MRNVVFFNKNSAHDVAVAQCVKKLITDNGGSFVECEEETSEGDVLCSLLFNGEIRREVIGWIQVICDEHGLTFTTQTLRF